MSSIGWPAPPQKVPKAELRQAFNEGDYLAKIQNGSLRTVLWSEGHATPQSGEPHCTRSQMLLYVTPQGNPVALVHQYRRQDGSLGASGVPDPKLLLTDDGRVLAS